MYETMVPHHCGGTLGGVDGARGVDILVIFLIDQFVELSYL